MRNFIELQGHYFDPADVIRLQPADSLKPNRWPLTVWFSESSPGSFGGKAYLVFDTKELRDAAGAEIVSLMNKPKDIPQEFSGKKVFGLVGKPINQCHNRIIPQNDWVYVMGADISIEEIIKELLNNPATASYHWEECSLVEAFENNISFTQI